MTNMRYLLSFLVALLLFSGSNVLGQSFLNESYIRLNDESESADSAHVFYIKYDFSPDGTGKETRFKIELVNDSPKMTKMAYPLKWHVDINQRLTIETGLSANIVTYEQYDILYGGMYLRNACPEVLHRHYPTFDFVMCSPEFLNPENIEDQDLLMKTFNEASKNNGVKFSSSSVVWPWKIIKQENWYQGTFRIEEFFKQDDVIYRIRVSKNGISYLLTAPPNRPHLPKSRLYNSWAFLCKLSEGNEVKLTLEPFFPMQYIFDQTALATYTNQTYSHSIYDCGISENDIIVCGNRACNMCYGILE